MTHLKLQLIEYLSQVIKALTSSAQPEPPTQKMLSAVEICADTIAHIAQYDRENLAHAFQIEHLKAMTEFLDQTLKAFATELPAGKYYVPSAENLATLMNLINEA